MGVDEVIRRLASTISVSAAVAGLCSVIPGVALAVPVSQANTTIFGPRVYVFDPTMPAADITGVANSVFTKLESAEFSTERYALLFKPGSYSVNFNVGYYTHVAGLGQSPDDVTINGGVNVNADWDNGNATRNFWRALENYSVVPANGQTQIAVSQAAPLRRLHIKGDLHLFDFDSNWNAGWASGGFLADSVVDGQVVPASQQQWLSRNSKWASWNNGVWNMVFVGVNNAPTGQFPNPPYTVIDRTPIIREKPYLYVNSAGQYAVFVPALQTNTQGVSWANGPTPGQALSIDQFYIARPETASAASINSALSQGKHLLFTPGVYQLNDTLRVNNANTVVLGIGLPTLIQTSGQPTISVADVDGVKIAGLLLEAGTVNSPSILEVGPAGSSKDHSANPTFLYDLTVRTGGAFAGRNDVGIKINSHHVVGDQLWLWRADHGAGAAWSTNPTKNGLVVNGNNVTIYGLFNEHHNEYQTVWNGNGGRVYFYQSEIPYDVPNQGSWMSKNGTVNGFASYKVADTVTTHEAWGLGVYSYFRDAAVKSENAIEAPNVQGVKFHNMTTIWLNGVAGSEITHVINGLGGRVYANSPAEAMRQTLNEYSGTGTNPPTGDTQAPTVPGSLKVASSTSTQVSLSWTASTDNVGVAAYDIYRSGSLVGSSTTTSYTDSGLAASTAYSYTVKARDAAGNASAASNTVSVTTPPGGSTGTALPRTGWTATSSPTSGEPASALLDGSMSTRWTTGAPMANGQSLTVDMQSAKTFTKIVMDSTGSDSDYARGYQVFVSSDGANWGSAIATGTGTGPVITVTFTARTARYIRVVQTGTNSSWWSMREFNVYN
ncbi:discoidin domain-containing protein [Cystobacter fuscus]|uniref:discoidin domain-containing protein n=1 Tax=Cystobacter fuscus TaxID=43 RepID=UPI0012DE5005|nr:discoidin domain-containing protein [Cystobacter fuscus]